MKQEIRNFKDFYDMKSFPGKLNKITHVYEFNTLYHIDDKNNKRMWKITVRLVKGDKKKYDIDWDLLDDDTIPIKASYLKQGKIPEGTNAQYYVETGVIGGKITRHIPSYTECKNINKVNERNVFEQALVSARSKYLKKIESGFTTNIDNNNANKGNNKYFPMLVHKYDEKKKNIKYPVLVQPKLDGTRCITFLNKPDKKKLNECDIDDVIMYTRQQKDYMGFYDIKKILLNVLIKSWDTTNGESIYLDGELYKHGKDLQTISGAVRNQNRDTIKEYEGIQYWLFDVFYPSNLSIKFIDRINILNNIFILMQKNDNIINTPVDSISDEKELDTIYNKYIKEKYEGIIIRNMDSLYLTNPTKESAKIRNKFVLKRKKRYSDEYELIDFKEGTKGRDVGAILWILKTTDKNGKEYLFNSTPKNMSYEERYKLFNELNSDRNVFNKKFKGRMMTVEYEDLSKKNIPLRAKSIGFREHV